MKNCKNIQTNYKQIGEEMFSKTTLFRWLKFKSIQIYEMSPICKR
jgi:hypothetical protein